MEGLMTAGIVQIPNDDNEPDSPADFVRRYYEGELTSEQVRRALYEIGSDAHLGCLALMSEDSDLDRDSATSIALHRLFGRDQGAP
jgi:hypothetical protein